MNTMEQDPVMSALRHYAEFCAMYFGFTPSGFLGTGRHATIAKPRKLAMAAAGARLIKSPSASLVQVGQAFGRVHGTVMHARKMIRAEHDPNWRENLDAANRLAFEWDQYYEKLATDGSHRTALANKIRSRIMGSPKGKATSLILVEDNGKPTALGSKSESDILFDIEAELAWG